MTSISHITTEPRQAEFTAAEWKFLTAGQFEVFRRIRGNRHQTAELGGFKLIKVASRTEGVTYTVRETLQAVGESFDNFEAAYTAALKAYWYRVGAA